MRGRGATVAAWGQQELTQNVAPPTPVVMNRGSFRSYPFTGLFDAGPSVEVGRYLSLECLLVRVVSGAPALCFDPWAATSRRGAARVKNLPDGNQCYRLAAFRGYKGIESYLGLGLKRGEFAAPKPSIVS